MVRAIAIFFGLLMALLLVASGVSLHLHRHALPGWRQFSIGPASGRSVSIGRGRIHAEGITILLALSVAYGMPVSRIVGPAWMSEARLAMDGEAPVEVEDSLQALLQQELKARLRLEVHFEDREFDAFALTASRPRLVRSESGNSRSMIYDRDARLERATMAGLASALQSILGRPVVDETGAEGWYDIEFAWGEDRNASVRETLHNRFGLELAESRRKLEALVVDRIEPDAAMSVLLQVGRMTNWAPPGMKRGISAALSIR